MNAAEAFNEDALTAHVLAAAGYTRADDLLAATELPSIFVGVPKLADDIIAQFHSTLLATYLNQVLWYNLPYSGLKVPLFDSVDHLARVQALMDGCYQGHCRMHVGYIYISKCQLSNTSIVTCKPSW